VASSATVGVCASVAFGVGIVVCKRIAVDVGTAAGSGAREAQRNVVKSRGDKFQETTFSNIRAIPTISPTPTPGHMERSLGFVDGSEAAVTFGDAPTVGNPLILRSCSVNVAMVARVLTSSASTAWSAVSFRTSLLLVVVCESPSMRNLFSKLLMRW
jgi:hypothetical protein